MSHERNLIYLNNNRIVYRRLPITDKPTIETDQYMFYENGTHECYELFRSSAKITTYKSLKWHLLVLWYLNPRLNPDDFNYLAEYIAHKPNGFVSFNVSERLLEKVIYGVSMSDLDRPPKNKLRKVIFKDYNMLTLSEKLSIVGKLIGRSSSVDAEAIYQCMLDLNESNKKITWARVAGLLDCSVRTIYRNLDKHLKKEKEILNEEI